VPSKLPKKNEKNGEKEKKTFYPSADSSSHGGRISWPYTTVEQKARPTLAQKHKKTQPSCTELYGDIF
jgi:hypothetical protein